MKWFISGLGSVAMFAAAVLGISMVKSWSEMNKPPRKVETDEDRYAKIASILEKPKAEKKQKYPKALPGGGLDWTGVEKK